MAIIPTGNATLDHFFLGTSWTGTNGVAAQVEYTIRARDGTGKLTNSFLDFNEQYVQGIEQALAEVTAVANIHFNFSQSTLNTAGSGAEFADTFPTNPALGDETQQLIFDRFDVGGTDVLGVASTIQNNDIGNDFGRQEKLSVAQPITTKVQVTLSTVFFSSQDFLPGGQGFVVLLHEIGHAVGLAHPDGDESDHAFTAGSFHTTLDGSVMLAGFPANGVHANTFTGANPRTPMFYDIAALQHLYGVNAGNNAGNNTYTFGTANEVRTIWDAGGVDTIDQTGSNVSVVLDLREAPDATTQVGGNFAFDNNGVFISTGNGSRIWFAEGSNIENAFSGLGNDVLFGNHLNNVVDGNAGNDTISGGGGTDTLEGGTGIDSLKVLSETAFGVNDISTINIDATSDQAPSESTFARGFENADASQATGRMTITGDMGNNSLAGGMGADNLRGLDGDDLIFGGSKFSFARFVASDATIQLLITELANGGAEITLATWNEDNAGINLLETNNFFGRDFINGNAGNDVIVAGDGNDLPRGGQGNDFINGGRGNDIINGDVGNDTLRGGQGNDEVTGGAGNDSLSGDKGDDVLFGGTGADIFLFDGNGGDIGTDIIGSRSEGSTDSDFRPNIIVNPADITTTIPNPDAEGDLLQFSSNDFISPAQVLAAAKGIEPSKEGSSDFEILGGTEITMPNGGTIRLAGFVTATTDVGPDLILGTTDDIINYIATIDESNIVIV